MRLDLDIAYPERLSVILDGDLPLLRQLLVGTLLGDEVQPILDLLPVENHGEFVVLQGHHHAVPFTWLFRGVDEGTRGPDDTPKVMGAEFLFPEAVEDLHLKPVGGGI